MVGSIGRRFSELFIYLISLGKRIENDQMISWGMPHHLTCFKFFDLFLALVK